MGNQWRRTRGNATQLGGFLTALCSQQLAVRFCFLVTLSSAGSFCFSEVGQCPSPEVIFLRSHKGKQRWVAHWPQTTKCFYTIKIAPVLLDRNRYPSPAPKRYLRSNGRVGGFTKKVTWIKMKTSGLPSVFEFWGTQEFCTIWQWTSLPHCSERSSCLLTL